MKRFNDERMKRFVKEETKIKTELFVLYFNDTSSVFKPILSDAPDETSWMTTKNSYYQNSITNQKLSVLALFGSDVFLQDSISYRPWKITESKRKISGYECRKAIYQKDDSTRLYAWFSPEIIPSTGPEGFSGLPGTILGLATEDGGVIYFAKSVEALEPKQEDMSLKIGKAKPLTLQEFKQKIEKEYGNTPWGKRMFVDIFRWL
jgi:GLPGLI family protein